MQDGLLYSPLIVGPVALIVALALYLRIKSLPDGNETMNRIGTYVREGSMAFLTREYKVLAVYSLVVVVLLGIGLGKVAAGAFLLGAFLSLLAGFFGMKAATYANVRTAQSAREGSKPNALLTALDGGAVMGLSVAGLGLLGLGVLFLVFRGSEAWAPCFTRSPWAPPRSRSSRVSVAVSIRRRPTWAPTSPVR